MTFEMKENGRIIVKQGIKYARAPTNQQIQNNNNKNNDQGQLSNRPPNINAKTN